MTSPPFYFGEKSELKLVTCHLDLQTVMRSVIQFYDISIIWGYRNEEQQSICYEAGNSTKKYPNSKHNHLDKNAEPLSLAVDVAPWFEESPHIRWNYEEEFIFLAGRVLQIADMLDISITWGGDWDRDGNQHDQHFNDLGHFELS